jgi:hypothetical protein
MKVGQLEIKGVGSHEFVIYCNAHEIVAIADALELLHESNKRKALWKKMHEQMEEENIYVYGRPAKDKPDTKKVVKK